MGRVQDGAQCRSHGQNTGGRIREVTWAEHRWENKGDHVCKTRVGRPQWEVTWAEPRLEGCPARGHVGSIQAGTQWEVTRKGLLTRGRTVSLVQAESTSSSFSHS